MKKVKSFIAIILLFSILFCFLVSKVSASNNYFAFSKLWIFTQPIQIPSTAVKTNLHAGAGHYITIVDRAGWTQTITTKGYSTSVTTTGEWIVVPDYTTTTPAWTELAISKFHLHMGSFGVLGTTSYVHHPTEEIHHPASKMYVSYPAITKQVWHRATTKYVWHPAVTHKVWVAAGAH
jgi:hypothetical protein